MRFRAHDWLVVDRSRFRFGFDEFVFRFGFDDSGSTCFRFDGFRLRLLPARLRFGRFRARRLPAPVGFFGVGPGAPAAAAEAPLALAACSEDRVVAGRHLHEDDSPEQGEADQRDRDHAARGALRPGWRWALRRRWASRLRFCLLDRIHRPSEVRDRPLSELRVLLEPRTGAEGAQRRRGPRARPSAIVRGRRPRPAAPRAGRSRRQSGSASAGTSSRWPSTWSVISATQAMKLSLWAKIRVLLGGPADEQRDAGAEQRQGGEDDAGREDPQAEVRRALADVRRGCRCSSGRSGSRCWRASAGPAGSAACR